MTLNRKLEHLGYAIILIPLLSYLLAVLCFAACWHITPLVFLCALTFGLYYLYSNSVGFKTLLLYLFVVALCISLGTYIWDVSFDGPWYHADLIHKLSYECYNPYYTWALSEEDLTAHSSSNWIPYYAKGYEIVAATIVSVTGNLESGKSENLLFFIGASMILYSLLTELLSNKVHQGLVLVVAMGNPVVLGQLFTHYIDWTCYILLLITLVSIYRMVICKDYHYQWLVFLVAILAINIKINIAFWIFIFSFILLTILFVSTKRQLRKKTVVLLCVGGGLGILAGFNPYFTNQCQKGHPLYPLAGDNPVDIMTMSTPALLLDKNRVEAVSMSLLMNPQNDLNLKCVTLKGILGLDKNSFDECSNSDTRLGGFGIFFFEALVCLLFLSLIVDYSYKKYYLLTCLLAYLSLLLLPSGWWARYVCYFYLVAPLLLLALVRTPRKPLVNAVIYVVFLLLILNSSLSLLSNCRRLLSGRKQYNKVLTYLQDNKNDHMVIRPWNALFVQKLKDRGIPFRIAHKESLHDSLRIKQVGPPVYVKSSSLGDSFDDDFFEIVNE